MPKLVSCVVIILSWIGLPVKGEEHKEWFQLSGIKEFQSTLPVWGGTMRMPNYITEYYEFQSTLPVRGGTLPLVGLLGIFLISIHPPREGRDLPM